MDRWLSHVLRGHTALCADGWTKIWSFKISLLCWLKCQAHMLKRVLKISFWRSLERFELDIKDLWLTTNLESNAVLTAAPAQESLFAKNDIMRQFVSSNIRCTPHSLNLAFQSSFKFHCRSFGATCSNFRTSPKLRETFLKTGSNLGF